MNAKDIESLIVDWVRTQLDVECSPEANFGALGLDSLDAVELSEVLAEKVGLEEVPVTWILDHPTPRRLAAQLASP